MATKAQLEAYRKTQERIEADFNKQLQKLWREVEDLPPEQIRNVLVDAIPELIDQYGSMCASFAADWFEALVQENAFVPDLYSYDAYAASTRWALSPLWDGSTDKAAAFAHLVSASDRHLRAYGRETISQSALRSKNVLFARVPTGVHTCEFCLLLASRGPVYGSKKIAQYASDGDKYHSDCDCIPVPMRGNWEIDESERGMSWVGDKVAGYNFEQLYSDVYKPFHKEGDSARDTVARMRSARATHANLLLSIQEKRDWPDSQRRELAFRQAALLSNTSGEKLDVREIYFSERFENLGNRFTWIKRKRFDDGAGKSANDFYWIEKGREYELKSPTKAKKSTIRNAIRADAIKRVDGIQVKERFIVDLGSLELSPSLRKELQGYNARMIRDRSPNLPSATIKELWVMSEDGTKFEQIELE